MAMLMQAYEATGRLITRINQLESDLGSAMRTYWSPPLVARGQGRSLGNCLGLVLGLGQALG